MKTERSFLQPLHTATKRDYLARMMDQKVHCMEVAERFDSEYWDGERRYGYGGYRYDGRWKKFAEELIKTYGLSSNSKVLDLGCGKAHLIFEISQLLPGITIAGVDISEHALKDAPQEIHSSLTLIDLREKLPYRDQEFDLVLSLNTLHNLPLPDFLKTAREMERVGKEKYLVVESYRNNQELFNLQCWALTCKLFCSPADWQELFKLSEYSGDYEFIYFE